MLKISYNSFLIHCAIILCAFQYYMGASSGPMDIVMMILLLNILIIFFRGGLRVDKIAIQFFLIVILGLMTLSVFKITETSWINLFRSNFYAAIVYIFVINLRQGFSLSKYVLLLLSINLGVIWLIFDVWKDGFSNFVLDVGYFNLNNMGFLSLMIFLSAVAVYQKKVVSNLIIFSCIVISLFAVLISFSRANYILLFLAFIYMFIRVFSFKERVFVIFLAFLMLPISIYFLKNESIYSGLNFLEKKASVGSPLEMLYSRWELVIEQPIKSYFYNREIIEMFFGGGLLPEHSLVLTFFTCFGLIALFVYLYLNMLMSKGVFTKNNLKIVCSLMIVMLFINDASTNASSYILLIKFIPIITYGLLIGRENERYKIKL